MSDTKALELLFQRPLEPVFTSRDNGTAALEVPDSYYTDRYSGSNVELQSRYGDHVEVKVCSSRYQVANGIVNDMGCMM